VAPLVGLHTPTGDECYLNANEIAFVAPELVDLGHSNHVLGSRIYLKGDTSKGIEVTEDPKTVFERASLAQRRG
jgi:hypothetical protein